GRHRRQAARFTEARGRRGPDLDGEQAAAAAPETLALHFARGIEVGAAALPDALAVSRALAAAAIDDEAEVRRVVRVSRGGEVGREAKRPVTDTADARGVELHAVEVAHVGTLTRCPGPPRRWELVPRAAACGPAALWKSLIQRPLRLVVVTPNYFVW